MIDRGAHFLWHIEHLIAAMQTFHVDYLVRIGKARLVKVKEKYLRGTHIPKNQ
jgi:hypothetical protein